MIGQKLTAIVLQQMVETKKVPSGLLFAGPSGTGKTTAARILASVLEGDAIEIDAASNGGVAEVRKLIDQLRYSSGTDYRVVVVDEAHSMTREAFNALLKTLEEPPEGTIFVLVTTEPEKIPETILTRLMEFEFRRVPPGEIFNRLNVVAGAENLPVSAELLHYLSQNSNGNVRTALNALDQIQRAGITTAKEYMDLTGVVDVAPPLVAALLTGNQALIFETFDKQLESVGNPNYVVNQILSCFRDMVVIRTGGQIQLSGQAYEIRRELGLKIEPERLQAAFRVLWDYKTRVRGSDNPRGWIEVALMLIADVFSRGKQQPVVVRPTPAPQPVSVAIPAPEEATERLSLADLQ